VVIDHVLAVMRGPIVMGMSDCCPAACDVFQRLHGIDPMAPLRGRYHTAIGAARIIARAGGFEALADDLAERAGLARCVWQPGALATAVMPTGPALVIGLDQPGWWAGRCEGGYQILRDVGRIWSKP
jgi:hypothetical protein